MKLLMTIAISLLSITESLSQDSYAQLIGGRDSLYTAIKKETILPDACSEAGKVFVVFEISEIGTTREATIAKGICPEADSIALTIVRRLNYIPAKRDGENIAIRQQVPIYFNREE